MDRNVVFMGCTGDPRSVFFPACLLYKRWLAFRFTAAVVCLSTGCSWPFWKLCCCSVVLCRASLLRCVCFCCLYTLTVFVTARRSWTGSFNFSSSARTIRCMLTSSRCSVASSGDSKSSLSCQQITSSLASSVRSCSGCTCGFGCLRVSGSTTDSSFTTGSRSGSSVCTVCSGCSAFWRWVRGFSSTTGGSCSSVSCLSTCSTALLRHSSCSRMSPSWRSG